MLGYGDMKRPELAAEEKVLVIIRDELYDGNWDEMLEDLKARLAGRPYVIKLASRIEDDMARITRLRALELEERINLADFVEKELK
jgi:hypothetical protein